MSEADVASPSACKRYGAKRHYYYSVPRDLKTRSLRSLHQRVRRIHDLLDLALGVIGQFSAPALEVGRNLAIHGALVRFLERIAQAAQQTAPVSGLARGSEKSSRSYRGAGVGHGVISSSKTDNPRHFQRIFFLLQCNIAVCGRGSRGRRAYNPCAFVMRCSAKAAHILAASRELPKTARGYGSRGHLAVRRQATYQPSSRKPGHRTELLPLSRLSLDPRGTFHDPAICRAGAVWGCDERRGAGRLRRQRAGAGRADLLSRPGAFRRGGRRRRRGLDDLRLSQQQRACRRSPSIPN